MGFKTQSLTPEVFNILNNKETERPFTGEYDTWNKPGTFLCRQCGLALFRSYAKFQSGCGWPSFDEEIEQALIYQPDFDGQRTEIVCARCQGHLGHVFHGEKYTNKNIRHCVNSLSIDFVGNLNIKDTQEALLAAGCFWGVEYYFKKLSGVLKTQAGYAGGHKDFPSYREVCAGETGHIETVRVIYDADKLNYKQLVEYFFEIHDATQKNGQGADIGSQYLSTIFYYDETQRITAEKVIKNLANKNYPAATKLLPAQVFWPAEENHQNYYQKMGTEPYCHRHTKIF